MITEKEYNKAQQVIKDYINQQLNVPIVNHAKFLQTIEERDDNISKLEELVSYLSYDNNPIGGREGMFYSMKKYALKQIIEINDEIEKIRKSLCSCS